MRYSKFTVFRLVWNLANNSEIEETNKKIERYKKENEGLIKKNTFKNVRFKILIRNYSIITTAHASIHPQHA